VGTTEGVALHDFRVEVHPHMRGDNSM